jgi:hypothetical protein
MFRDHGRLSNDVADRFVLFFHGLGMALMPCHHIDFVAFDVARKLDRWLPIDDSLAKLLDHGSRVTRAQLEFLGDLQTRQVETHEIQANDPGLQWLMMTGENGIGEVIEALSTRMTLVSLPVWLGFVSTILDDPVRRAMRTSNTMGPAQGLDGLEALRFVDEIPDVYHDVRPLT